jgi:hypothetical protein
MAKNKIIGSTIRGATHQSSDVANTENSVESSETSSLVQRIRTKASSMQFLGGQATGTIGVIALAVVLIGYLVYRILIAYGK